jgi:hypothetical protein
VKTKSSTIETPRSHLNAWILLLTLASSMINQPAFDWVASLIGAPAVKLKLGRWSAFQFVHL